MGSRGDFDGGQDIALYTAEQVEAVLDEIGIDVTGETVHDFLGFCPYHGNRFTPSFSVSKTTGTFCCYSASCDETGNLVQLIKHVSDRGEFSARRLIAEKKNDTGISFEERMRRALAKKVEFKEFPPEVIAKCKDDFWLTPKAIEYMRGRGFEDETLKVFNIGYSDKQDLITVPVYTQDGMPIGVVGRSPDPDNKAFKNSKKLPTSKTLWNLHRARRHGETVIITEASFDAMRVHQAGYPNVVACLGGNFSVHHLEQLDRTFNTIIIMTDFDKRQIYEECKRCKRAGLNLCIGHNPGRDLGKNIAKQLSRKKILWASYDERMVYPHGAKDAGDMTDNEIRTCLKNAVTNYTYSTWGLY